MFALHGAILCAHLTRLRRRLVRPLAHEREEDVPEAAATEAVDDEVDGRVDNHHDVAEARVVEKGVRTLLVVDAEHAEQDLRDEGGRLTDDEDEHHDDQHQRDVVLRLRPDVEKLSALALRLAQHDDQLVVEQDEHDAGQDEHDDAVQQVLVDDLVGLVARERRDGAAQHGAVVRRRRVDDDHIELEEARHVEGDREEKDERHVPLGVTQRAELGRVVRPAHRHVAVESDEDRQVYGAHLGRQRAREDVLAEVGEDADERREAAGVRVHGGEDAHEQDGKQEERVGHLERHEQERRRRLGPVAPQTHHRQRVADEAEQTEQAWDEGLGKEVVKRARLLVAPAARLRLRFHQPRRRRVGV